MKLNSFSEWGSSRLATAVQLTTIRQLYFLLDPNRGSHLESAIWQFVVVFVVLVVFVLLLLGRVRSEFIDEL